MHDESNIVATAIFAVCNRRQGTPAVMEDTTRLLHSYAGKMEIPERLRWSRQSARTKEAERERERRCLSSERLRFAFSV